MMSRASLCRLRFSSVEKPVSRVAAEQESAAASKNSKTRTGKTMPASCRGISEKTTFRTIASTLCFGHHPTANVPLLCARVRRLAGIGCCGRRKMLGRKGRQGRRRARSRAGDSTPATIGSYPEEKETRHTTGFGSRGARFRNREALPVVVEHGRRHGHGSCVRAGRLPARNPVPAGGVAGRAGSS